MKILIAGDYCDRYRVTDCIKNKEYAKMFDGIKHLVHSFDFAVLNFEFPIVKTKGFPIVKSGPNLKGQPSSIDAIKYAGFNVCTLANNHILDQGEQCCLDTENLLEKAGIKTVGIGTNLKEASNILYLSKDGLVLAIVNCAEHEFSYATENSAGANPINPIRQYHQIQEAKNKADYVIVITHGGHEHFNLPSPRMKELYRFFIEVGADAVVNHHQHCISGYEVYNGKPIFYGLGNLLFDNPTFRETFWNKGYMVEFDLHDGSIDFEILPYTQCNEEPVVELLNEEQKIQFAKEVEELNRIIGDDAILMSKVDEYYKKNIKNELDILEPYRGRVLNKLLDLGLLPHLISGSKVPGILNHVNCESHRDKLVYALTQKNK